MVRKPAAFIFALVAMLSSTDAHAQYFGRNKVHYDRLDFRLLKTEHFDIYYYPEEEDATVHAARMAERWYARFSRILQHTFRQRQPLILYASHAHFAQTNLTGGPIGEGVGGFTERGKTRIAMPFAVGLGETDHVLGHEIAHAFQIDIARSVKQDAFALPGWFIEGMAEYLSMGPATSHTTMWVRDAKAHGRLPTLAQLKDPKYFPYRYGHALWSHLAAQHGDAIFGAVLRVRGRGDAIRRLEQATGRSAEELTTAWHASIAPTAAAEPEGRLVVDEERGRMQLGPSLSPDGTRAMFLSERDRLSVGLYLADTTDEAPLRKLLSSTMDPHFDSLQYIQSAGTWDPSGRRFAMTAVRQGDPVLVLIDAERGDREERPLPGVRQAFNPSWSPDGAQIVLSGLAGGLADLYVYTLETGTLTPLTGDLYADVHPAWSPDGRTIAFATDRLTSSVDELRFGPLRVALLDLETGTIRPLHAGDARDPVPEGDDGRDAGLAGHPEKEINPQWSPDGGAVYYIADYDGTSHVFRRTLTTGALHQVTNAGAGISGITAHSPALAVAARSGAVAVTNFSDGVYRLRVLEDCTCGAVDGSAAAEPAAHAAGAAASNATTVAAAIQDARTGLPDASGFTHHPYDDRLRLESLAQPFIGGTTSSAFGGLVRASFGATFGDLLRDRQLQTLVRVGTDLDDFAAQVAYTTRRGRWNWGVTAGFVPARFSGARRAIDRGVDSTTRETASLRYDHQWLGLAARYHIDAVRRVETRVGLRRTGFEWQTATRVTDGTGTLIDRSFVESAAGPALYQAEAQIAYVHDTAIFGPVGPILGQRLRVEVEPAFGRVPFTDVTVDARRYWMPVRPLTIAARVEHIGRYGSGATDPRLTPLVVGLQTLIRGYDLRSFAADECGRTATECSLLDELTGSRLALMNLELRAPLAGVLTGELDYGRFPIEVIAFADAGALWTRQAGTSPERTVFRSVGAGGRVNLGGMIIEVTASRPFDRSGRGWTTGLLLRPGW